MKRFTPRARGRAGAIKKRSTHITIVVDRLDDRRLEVVQAREARRTAAGRRRGAVAGGTAASRRERVERSRQRAATLKSGDAVVTDENASAIADADDEIEHGTTDQVDRARLRRQRRTRGRRQRARGLRDQGQRRLDAVPRAGQPLLQPDRRRGVLRHRRERRGRRLRRPRQRLE